MYLPSLEKRSQSGGGAPGSGAPGFVGGNSVLGYVQSFTVGAGSLLFFSLFFAFRKSHPPYLSALLSSAQPSSAQLCSSAQGSAVRCRALRCSAVLCGAVLCGAVLRGSMPCCVHTRDHTSAPGTPVCTYIASQKRHICLAYLS